MTDQKLRGSTGLKLAPSSAIHPAWVKLIRYCQTVGHGEIERIRIQDGVPVLIERSVERIKLT